ncbi:entericidin A/B family lipoprotein [Thiosocius teredinicola]|uniref:entericidin A/B family lipoprotein n=1 Tax=Thiosocius teredinicola TaxID=1973002 RepID=UPI002FE47B92
MNRVTIRKITMTLFAAVMAFTALTTLSGCNTVAGAGEDIEAAGDAIENKAEKEKSY